MKNVPVIVAAELIGKSPQYIRIGLQKERLPFGNAVLLNKRWSYNISPFLLGEYIGDSNLLKEYKERCD